MRVAALSYPALTALVVLATANHYLFDIVAGAALWAGVQAAVSHLRRIDVL